MVGGFEPVDLLEAIAMLVAQLEEGRAEVENQYARSVESRRQSAGANSVREVFEVSDRKWRGIGPIAESGLPARGISPHFDAERVFNLDDSTRRRAEGMHQRAGAAGSEEANRLPGFRQALHADDSAGRAHGFG